MPTYDIATTAFAIGATRKWVDNIASHHDIGGIERSARGVERAFAIDAVVSLRIVHALAHNLHIPVWRAVQIAAAVQLNRTDGIVDLGEVALTVDTKAISRDVRRRLLEAAESVPRARRGRPKLEPEPPAATP